ncbi:diguanylate cyclase (GGDEF)-like protein [Natranaerovirga pectinivora]|uniref:Diguanylate cyclase (GGDEF)-like protein n=1 Tax=Natranaerovirga pectinivora TaxID=682400 RepID=A0A4R3MNE2_9FIRM|nr:EAL domain-containing protein [Natranaerovirga pectinivora]TCT14870.1 diguanylate cyclase (GGDEF)-like protein [Natranaerovirga pectinivora]
MKDTQKVITNNFKLIYLPIVFTLMAIFTIAIFTHNLSQRILFNQKEENVIEFTKLLSSKIELELNHQGINKDESLGINLQRDIHNLQNIVERTKEENDTILYALIVDENLICIADSDVEDIGIDYSGDLEYEKALNGVGSVSTWYYPIIDDYVLEAAVPLRYGEDIIGIVGVGISMDETKKNVAILTFGSFIMAVVISIIFFITQRINVIQPILTLNKHIRNINTDDYYFKPLEISKNKNFEGLYNTINELFDKLNESLHKNFNLNEEIKDLAYKDYLTKIPNRISFARKFHEVILNNKIGAIALLDLDSFKEYNDTKGHLNGDRLLVAIAQRLIGLKGEGVYISRFGGDEFLVFIYHQSEERIKETILELENLFKRPFYVQGEEVIVEASMGISLYPEHDKELDGLISKADLAMYEAKTNGKNQWAYFTESLLESAERKNYIHSILRSSITNNEFKILYQPQVDVFTGETVGFEALLRFKNHNIFPDEFIPIAEEKGLIIPIGRMVIKEVFHQLSQWKDQGLEITPIAINFSVKQLNDEGLINYIEELLKEYTIETKYIEVEITENILIDSEGATKFLNSLKALGIKISLDDFGTGYSSLNYLSKFPVAKMKLDRSFIQQYLNVSSQKIMKQLILLAKAYDLEVVAEGVETLEQVKLLQKLNCDYIQGYYFSKPVDTEIVLEIIRKKYDV